MKKLNKLKQTHGQDTNSQELTLDEILGKTKLQGYSHKTEAEYTQWLNSLSTSDIEKEAVRRQFIPVVSRAQLIKKLISAYKNVVGAVGINDPANRQHVEEPDEQSTEAIRKILNRF